MENTVYPLWTLLRRLPDSFIVNHHISRETIYKNYYFLYGTSIKSSELLERLEGTKTETELETVNGKV